MVEQVVVGIDVSKAKLDVAILPSGEQFTVSNDRHGVGELVRRLSPLAPSRVVLEATGKLEQLAVSELAAAGLPVGLPVTDRRPAIKGKACNAIGDGGTPSRHSAPVGRSVWM